YIYRPFTQAVPLLHVRAHVRTEYHYHPPPHPSGETLIHRGRQKKFHKIPSVHFNAPH
uniref:Uncharacterized protein n=1 Tax=Gasterosteus aculeatus TaxID=69293 RepID=G3Q9I1_GASAC